MSEEFFTVVMLIMAIALYFLKYVLPVITFIIGVALIKKKHKKIGYVLAVLGILAEIIAICTRFL